MDITQGNLVRLFTGFKALLLAAVKEAKLPEDVVDFVVEVPSSKSKEEYPTGALLGDLEELLDQYTTLDLGKFVQEIPNRFFGRILRVPRGNIEDEDMGVYNLAMQRFGRLAATHPYRRLPQLFINGFATPWGPDGANVFSANHQWPGGAGWSNITNGPLNVVNYRAARLKLRTRPGPDGQALELRPTHLICGPSNETVAKAILRAENSAPGVTNPDRDEAVKIVVWGALTGASANYWFLVDTSDEKPIIVQNRDAPALTAKTDPSDANVFYQEIYEFKTARRYGRAIVLPHLIEASQWGAEGETTTTAGG